MQYWPHLLSTTTTTTTMTTSMMMKQVILLAIMEFQASTILANFLPLVFSLVYGR
jgi:hypothetical protein